MKERSTFGYTAWDVEDRPQVVIWEATRACALACRHCRASAQRRARPDELGTVAARALIAQVARMRPQVFVVTGGDPLERADLYDLISHAHGLGLRVSLAPSVTPLLDPPAVTRLAALGIGAVQVSLDGPDAETHDRFRGHVGTFARTLETCAWIRDAGVRLMVGTTVARHNAEQLDEMYDLVASLGAARWNLFFLVPTGRARADEMIDPSFAQAILTWLVLISRDAPFAIKTTEAPQIRRVMTGQGPVPAGHTTVADGKGFVFIAANGDICPSGFLPLPAGNSRNDDILEVYRSHPLFRALRDPEALTGPRCSRCSHRAVCGGSRSRAYAVHGDPLGDDPLCAYLPAHPSPTDHQGGGD